MPIRGLAFLPFDDETLRDPKIGFDRPEPEETDLDAEGARIVGGLLGLDVRMAGSVSFNPAKARGFSLPSPLARLMKPSSAGSGSSSKIWTSSRIRPDELMPLSSTDSFGDFLCGEWPRSGRSLGWFAAMFFSDADMPSIVVSSVPMAKGSSTSMGMVRTERGRFPKAFLRMLGGASRTGEGDREGSFSLLALVDVSDSLSETVVSRVRVS
jgi:hypothetical protein